MKPNISLRELLPTPTMLAISLRNLKRSRTRTFLSALGIIIGVFAICTLGMAGAAFTGSINDMLEENTSMLLITSTDKENAAGGQMAFIPLTDDDVAEIESATKAVTTDYELVKVQYGYNILTVNHDEIAAIVLCGNRDKIPVITGSELIEGKLPRMDYDILVPESFVQTHNVRIGSHLKASAADGEELTLKITGIVSETIMTRVMGLMFGSNIVLGTNELYNRLVGQESGTYAYVNVMLPDTTMLNPVENAIDRKMNGKTYKTRDNRVEIRNTEVLITEVKDILSMAMIVGVAVSAIALLVASISIVNIMIIAVQERTHEIGLMRAIGTFRAQIVRVFLYEAAFIGLFGAIIGVLLSSICVSGLLYLLSGSLSAMLLPSVWIYIPLSMAIGVVVCVLAGLYPAIKAAMMNPIDAMAKAR